MDFNFFLIYLLIAILFIGFFKLASRIEIIEKEIIKMQEIDELVDFDVFDKD